MTCIAYRAGVLAGDTMIVDDGHDLKHYGQRKVFRLRNGTLVGTAGTLADCQTFMRWVRAGMPNPEPQGLECEALIVRPDGLVLNYEDMGEGKHVVSEVSQLYTAIGSGASVGMGCMWKGGSAQDAVRSAIDHAQGCGGKVQSVKLKPKSPS